MRDGSTGKDMLEGQEIDTANADKIMNQLLASNATIGLAESITAGGISNRLASIPGASKVLIGAVVCYTRPAKENLLGIPAALLDEQGTVSADVALALAEGALRVFNSSIGFGITGNAGPSTDGDKSAVGEVFMAIVSNDGDKLMKNLDLFGPREVIRAKAITEALRMIREFVLKKYY